MGGAYGNFGALAACPDDAARAGAQLRAFLGDAIGCCGHSEEIVAMIHAHFEVCDAARADLPAAEWLRADRDRRRARPAGLSTATCRIIEHSIVARGKLSL